jgi:two-component system, OmpR family, sensor histidine kinase SenX3
MRSGGRRASIAFVTILGIGLVGGALSLYVGWVIVNWRQVGLLVLGLLVFPLIIAGVVLNTIFLVREIRRNEQHEAFINAVTHELKTPVASMKLYLQTLQNHNVTEAKRQQFYVAMIEDSDRLAGTIERVLRAAQLGARAGHLVRRPVDLAAVVGEQVALATARHHLQPQTIAYQREGDDQATRVMGDQDELGAVVANLIDNAVKYSHGDVRIDISLGHTDRGVVLKVRDHGIGISEDERKRIFKRFYRIPGVATRHKGTGLGLFIVRSAVKRHQGNVSVTSDGPGRGSTFVVELPRLAAS